MSAAEISDGLGAESVAAARAAGETNISMEETSGERDGTNRLGALSGPDRLKPVPAVLCLSPGRGPAGVAGGLGRRIRGVNSPARGPGYSKGLR